MATKPFLLALDTSGPHCAVALLGPGGRVFSRDEPMEKGQAERLLPLLEEVMTGAGAGWHDLDALAVGTGPGNFSGVRISVAAARGLALARGLPAIGVTALEALAFGHPGPVLAVMDARRGQAYAQAFHDGIGARAALVAAGDLPPGLDSLHGMTCIGDLAGLYAQATGAATAAPLFPLPEAITRQAAARLGRPQPRPAPFYLRGADAAPPSDPPPVILDA